METKQPVMTETMWAAMRGRHRPECAGCGYDYASPSDRTYAEQQAREAAHNAKCGALKGLASLTDEERAMSSRERTSHWLGAASGRGERIRCGPREERRSLLREHADGSCHDSRLEWWPAGSWRRK